MSAILRTRYFILASNSEAYYFENKEYPGWFEPLYENLNQKSTIGGSNMISVEEKSQVPLYNFLGDWIDRFVIEVSNRNVGVFIDQIANFYSRVSTKLLTKLLITTLRLFL